MIECISQVVLPVDDQDRAKDFWTEAVGFDLLTDEHLGDERWIEVCPPSGPPKLVLSQREGERQVGTARPEHPTSPVMFACADLRATHRELERRGVAFAQPPIEMPFGWWSMFVDPEGNRFELGQLG